MIQPFDEKVKRLLVAHSNGLLSLTGSGIDMSAFLVHLLEVTVFYSRDAPTYSRPDKGRQKDFSKDCNLKRKLLIRDCHPGSFLST